MKESNKVERPLPFKTSETIADELTSLCIKGAREMLQAALESEVSDYVAKFTSLRDEHGKRLVVRNGHHPERSIQTGLGDIEIRKPKVNDRRYDEHGDRIRFTSSIIPPYLKRSKSVEEFLPWLYLRGISSGDFSSALEALLGKGASGLSASTIVRLKDHWMDEYRDWNKRSLKGQHYVYMWADGVYPRIRLDDSNSQCLLVILGATKEGKKELIAIAEGARESKDAWREVLLDLKARGLEHAPSLGIGDGATGFWSALSEVFPDTHHQRFWVHKTCNVLDKMPKSVQARAKSALHEIWMADTKTNALNALDLFCEKYGDKYERAVECLNKDKDELLRFYDFPAQHWKHIRTTNPIESMFATIRLRTKRTKGHGSSKAALAMAFKLAQCAERKWNRLAGHELLADVISIEYKFVDGIKVLASAA